MQTPPSRNSLAPESFRLDNAESPLILIHWGYGDTAHYNGWLLQHRPCPPHTLDESPELSELGTNVYSHAVTAYPYHVRRLCQFPEIGYVTLDSAVTSALCLNKARSGQSPGQPKRHRCSRIVL